MTIVIAEAGENHCGDMELARRLVDAAAQAKCDYVKFQLYDANRVARDDPEFDWFQRVQVSRDQWFALADYARDQGIRPLATPWDPERAQWILDAGVDAIKIASFHTTDHELLRYVNGRARSVFLSTGMSDLGEVKAAVAVLKDVPEVHVLHCVSEYPLDPARANLRVMDTLRDALGERVGIGYSDHTIGILAPVAAVARGAQCIEKHITLDKNMEGTDHILSADPGELVEMVSQIRQVETLLGLPEKRLTEAEASNQTFMRNRFRH